MPEKILRSYARRIGKGLSSTARATLEQNLELYNPLQPENQNWQEIILEIGFGKGEHLLHLARLAPNNLYIGAEAYLNGVYAVLKEIETEKISNIRLWPNDIFLLLEAEGCKHIKFNKIYILFPDPWPKRKQQKRRLISKQNMAKLLPYLAPEGKIIIATDHADYANWIENELAELVLTSKAQPENWYNTRYQTKALAGNNVYFFTYKKDRLS